MCRYEPNLYLHNLRDLRDDRVDLRIPKGLSKGACSRMGVKWSMDSHSEDTVPCDYSLVKNIPNRGLRIPPVNDNGWGTPSIHTAQ